MNELKVYTNASVAQRFGFDRFLNAMYSTVFLVAITATLIGRTNTDLLPQLLALTVAGIAGWTDLRGRVIPNILILAGLAAAILLTISGKLTLTELLASGAGALLSVLVIRWLGSQLYGKPGFGMGDAKLFMVLGMLLSAEVFWVLYMSIMLAGCFAVGGMALGCLKRESSFAFAPFIALAVLIDVHWISWNQIWRWLIW